MDELKKTKQQLIDEVSGLRQRIEELEKAALCRNQDTEIPHAVLMTAGGERISADAILSAVGDPVSIQDTEFRVLFQNQAHKKLAGDHAGKYCYKAYVNKDAVCGDCPIAMAFEDGLVHTVEKDGTEERGMARVEITASPLWDRDGKIVAGIEVVRNVSERREAEEALRREKEKAQQYLDIADVLLVVLDRDEKVTLINRKASEVLGCNERDIVGKNWFDNFVPGSTREKLRGAFRKVIAGEIEVFEYYESRVLSCSGKERIIHWHNKILRDEAGRIVGTISSGEDVTEKRKMEMELQTAMRLDSLGRLAGGIAHNFNNILTVIDGNISLAKMYAKPHMEVFDILQEVEKASLRAKNLVQQLLTFSKGGVPIKKRLSVRQLINDSAHFVLHDSAVPFNILFSDDLWTVEADEGQIAQVLNNIILNARQSSSGKGIITVRAENTDSGSGEESLLKEGRYVRISISDKGPGIPKEDIEKVFDPYYTTNEENIGLGLATAYSIVKKHGGYIDLDSEPGQGTTFSLYLPASAEEASVFAQSEQVSMASRIKGRVLVMEDEKIVRDVIKRMLDQCGYEAVFARDGREALFIYHKAKMSGNLFDAVILDLVIPEGMGGKETIGKLLEIDPNVTAIVSSGYSHDPVMATYKEFGFKSFLPKPYKVTDLRAVLEQTVKRRAG